MAGIDLDTEYDNSVIYFGCDDYLRILFEEEFGEPKAQLKAVAWFHLTRTVRSCDFSEGILPLGQVLDRIWEMLDSLLGDSQQKSNLSIMRAFVVQDSLFKLKLKNDIHHGPYAMLVRDAAFNPGKISNHDYLEIPEIIEDICNAYSNQFGHCIYHTITSKLEKCIVKFESDKNISCNLLAPAILYCWCVVRKEKFSSYANTCFDSEGIPIFKSQIVSVNFL